MIIADDLNLNETHTMLKSKCKVKIFKVTLNLFAISVHKLLFKRNPKHILKGKYNNFICNSIYEEVKFFRG